MTHEFRPGFEFDVPRLQSWLAIFELHFQQFANRLYGPMFAAGPSLNGWQT